MENIINLPKMTDSMPLYFWIAEANGERRFGGSSQDLPLAREWAEKAAKRGAVVELRSLEEDVCSDGAELARMFIRAEDDVLSSSDLCARWQNGVEIQK